MRALDTSILVAALHDGAAFHHEARRLLVEQAEGRTPWAIPWPCVYETLRIVTDRRLYHPPMPLEAARKDVAAILASPSLVMLAEGDRHAQALDRVLAARAGDGPMLEVARVAAICLEHAVAEVLTLDLDLMRFPGLVVRHPFRPPSGRGGARRARLTR